MTSYISQWKDVLTSSRQCKTKRTLNLRRLFILIRAKQKNKKKKKEVWRYLYLGRLLIRDSLMKIALRPSEGDTLSISDFRPCRVSKYVKTNQEGF